MIFSLIDLNLFDWFLLKKRGIKYLCTILLFCFINCTTMNYVASNGIRKKEYENELNKIIGYPDIITKQISLYELNTPIKTVKSITGKNAVSFSTDNMPLDLAEVLRQYSFYDYVLNNTDYIIMCPEIVDYDVFDDTIKKLGGLSVEREGIYQGKNVIIIRFYSQIEYMAYVIIHEAAHHEFRKYLDFFYTAVNESDRPKFLSLYSLLGIPANKDIEYYKNFTERFARLKTLEFMDIINNFHGSKLQHLQYLLSKERERITLQIEKYNSSLGLTEQNMDFFPFLTPEWQHWAGWGLSLDENGTLDFRGPYFNGIIPSQIDGIQVTTIRENAFKGKCKELDNIMIPEGVTSIGDFAFAENQLTSVTIPSSISSIGTHAFSNCQLKNVIFLGGVTSIGNFAFTYNQLTELTIHGNVSSIGNSAFTYNQLTELTIHGNVSSIGSDAFSGYSLINTAFAVNQLKSVTIYGNVSSIGFRAFSHNQLTDVNIHGKVTSIGDSAFSENKLKYVTFLDHVNSIGSGAFSFNSLIEITIPGSVSTIGDTAFHSNELKNVIILDGVVSIGTRAFVNNQLASIAIPDSVSFIGESAFRNNPLTKIKIGDNVSLAYERGYSSSFDSFDFYYGSIGGTFIYNDDKWNRELSEDD